MEDNNEMNEKKKIDLAALADETGKGVKSLLDKTKDGIVNTIDQNDDGAFDRQDIAVIADSVSTVAKNTAITVMEGIDYQRKEIEKKLLRPIFEEDLSDAEFALSKLIRITSKDKAHAESEVCQGSIGHITVHKDMQVVNIYRNALELFGLTFSPDDNAEFYYVNPTDRNSYIELDDYFKYMKIERINELKLMAQDLGASYLKVTYKESKKSFSKKQKKAEVERKFDTDTNQPSRVKQRKDKNKAKQDSAILEAIDGNSFADAETIGISTEVRFKNVQSPIEPKLNYLKRDPEIAGIIAMRLKKNTSELSGEVYRSESSKTLGMKQSDAMKIDSVLKAMKVKGDISVTDEFKTESRRFFEYIIEF